MDPGAEIRALRASFWRQTAPIKRGKVTYRGTQGRAPGRPRSPPKRECLQNQGGEILGLEASFYLDDLLSQGLIYWTRPLDSTRTTIWPGTYWAAGIRCWPMLMGSLLIDD